MDDDRVEDLREEVWRFLGVEACWWAGPVGVELGRVVPGDGGHNQVVEDVQRGDRVEDILDEGQSGGVGPHHRGWVVSQQERRRIDPDQTRSRCRQGRTKHPISAAHVEHDADIQARKHAVPEPGHTDRHRRGCHRTGAGEDAQYAAEAAVEWCQATAQPLLCALTTLCAHVRFERILWMVPSGTIYDLNCRAIAGTGVFPLRHEAAEQPGKLLGRSYSREEDLNFDAYGD
jgi:hypothetical protein